MDQSEDTEAEAAAAKAVSPTTEWRIKAEFFKLMENIKLKTFPGPVCSLASTAALHQPSDQGEGRHTLLREGQAIHNV